MRSTMMRRERVVIRDAPALLIALDRLRPATFVVDVEPMVVPWDSAPALFASAAHAFAQTVRTSVPSVTSVIYSSNSRRPGGTHGESGIRIVTGAHKPWQTRYLRNEPRPVAVAGDQVLTDGLLAWRLGTPFLHWQVAGPMPRWPRLQRWFGRIAAPLLFRDQNGSST
jgi:predicted HAD superfamily phosphohydrolase YqeG